MDSNPAVAMVHQLYAPIVGDMERVRIRYRRELNSDDPGIARLLAAIEHYSGKMLRPALLLLTGRAFGEINDNHITLAAVAEMIHTATLVHDDILDDALMRRQRPSINQLAGQEISVLLGDHLFSHALEMALELDDPVGAHRFSRAVSRTCLGEVTQVNNRGNYLLDEETYYRIIRGKTAELYATSSEIGAYYAGASSEDVRRMYDYGMSLGVAFQIMDDLLDLRGDEALVGKTLGTDLANGKMTLPLIHYLSQLGEAAQAAAVEQLRQARDTSSRSRVLRALKESGSLDYAEARARDFVQQAKTCAECVPDEALRGFFARIADFVIEREL